jgi:hypothetical protein
MAEARCRERWAHTSSVLALMANLNRDPKKTRAFRPSDFAPYAAPIGAARPADKPPDLGLLKEWCRQQKGIDHATQP